MENFPEELLAYIFSFLPASDREGIGFVCKRWHHIIWNTKSLSKDYWIILTNSNSSELCSLQRDLSSIQVEDMQSLESLSFWEANGTKVIALELYSVDLSSPVLYEILQYCPNLKYLLLSGASKYYDEFPSDSFCDDFVMPSVDLSNLTRLRFLHTLNVNFSFIPKFTEKIKRLKELEITFSNLFIESLYSEIASDVLGLIHENSRTLTQLKFLCCSFIFDHPVMISYMKAVGPQLKGIFYYDDDLSFPGVFIFPHSIAYKFKNRIELDLGYTSHPFYAKHLKDKLYEIRVTEIDYQVLDDLCQFEEL